MLLIEIFIFLPQTKHVISIYFIARVSLAVALLLILGPRTQCFGFDTYLVYVVQTPAR